MWLYSTDSAPAKERKPASRARKCAAGKGTKPAKKVEDDRRAVPRGVRCKGEIINVRNMSTDKLLEQVTTFVSGLRSHAQVVMEEQEQMSDPNVPHVEMAAVGMAADCGAKSAAEAQPSAEVRNAEAQPSTEVRNAGLRRSARGQAGAIPEGEQYAAIIEESIYKIHCSMS